MEPQVARVAPTPFSLRRADGIHARVRRALSAIALVAITTACGSEVPLGTPQPGDGTQESLSVPDGIGGAIPTATTAGGVNRTPSQAAETGSANSSAARSQSGGGQAGTSVGSSLQPRHSTVPTQPSSTGSGAPAAVSTGPVEVGILAPTSPAAAATALGGSAPAADPQAEIKFYVNYLNAHGGVDGRHIVPVEYSLNPETTSYQSAVQAACADFTEDHHVAVAISFETNYLSENYEACLSKAGVPDVAILSGGTDQSDLARYPTLISPSSPTVNERYGALIEGLTGNHFLRPTTKVGVIVEDCPYNERAYSATLAPLFNSKHLSVTRRDVGCLNGFGDVPSFITQVDGAVLPFKIAGVTRVMFVTNYEGVAAFAFQTLAQTQQYAPSYALTSTASPGVNGMEFSAAAEARVAGIGWEPDFDVTNPMNSSEQTKHCRAVWAAYGPASRTMDWTDDVVCDAFGVLGAALAKSGGSLAASTLATGFNSLGKSFSSPLTLQGATFYAANEHAGPSEFATVGYKSSCACFVYTSKPQPFS